MGKGKLSGFKEVLFLRFDDGQELISELISSLEEMGVRSGVIINAIGMLRDFQVGWFNVEEGRYQFKEFKIPHELISLQGNISELDGKPFPHIHVTLAGPDHTAIGGHLKEGIVCNTVEMFIGVLEERLYREGSGTFKPLTLKE